MDKDTHKESSKSGRVKNNLKEILIKKGLSQVELANAVEITRATISNIINNKFQTSMEMGFRIAEYLDVPITEIFYYEKSDGTIFESSTEKILKNTASNINQQIKILINEQDKMKKVIEKVTEIPYDKLAEEE